MAITAFIDILEQSYPCAKKRLRVQPSLYGYPSGLTNAFKTSLFAPNFAFLIYPSSSPHILI
jgi:hypothetical protein